MGNNPGNDLIPLSYNNDLWKYLQKIMGPSSVEHPASEILRIFPNPRSGKVQVDSDQVTGPYTLSVFDLHGRQLLQQENNRILDLSNLPNGLYQVILTDNGGSNHVQVIKQ